MASSLVNQKYNEQLIHQLKKKEKHTRDLLEQMTKKFKNLEKKSQEDSKISLELKKRHDVMQKKAQIATKEKADQNKQLKALYTVFQKQRKALELSIKKNKKLHYKNRMSLWNQFIKSNTHFKLSLVQFKALRDQKTAPILKKYDSRQEILQDRSSHIVRTTFCHES